MILSDALNQNSMIEEVRRSGSEKKIWRQSYIDLSKQIAHDIDIAEATVEVHRTSRCRRSGPLASRARPNGRQVQTRTGGVAALLIRLLQRVAAHGYGKPQASCRPKLWLSAEN